MYKLKIVVVINNNWHFWTLLRLGIQVPAVSQWRVMLKTALTFEEQAELHALDDAVKFLRASVHCFLFLPPLLD